MFAHLRLALFGAIVIALMFTFGSLTTSVQATHAGQDDVTPTLTPEPPILGETPSVEDQEAIKSIIQAYFDIRYNARSASQRPGHRLDGFGDTVSEEPDAKAFANKELGKLAVEARYAELQGTRYVDYKYFLNFQSFILDTATQLVTVSLREDKEVISESSARDNPANPHVDQISGLKHTIVMRKEQDQWRIVSDDYLDFLWRTLRRSGKSPEEILAQLSTKKPVQASGPAEAEIAAVLPADPSSHEYLRNEAAAYAVAHAAFESYNPDYPNYDDGDHGDCTNFVSQALYEGGNVSMFLPKVNGVTVLPPPSETFQGEEGWYMLWAKQRGRYWSEVGPFYDFAVTSYQFWDEGPEATEFPAGLMVGDVIQYNDPIDAEWAHEVIVIGFDSATGKPKVASHSPNVPDSFFDQVVAYDQIRFIHIERSDGNPPVKAEIQGNPFTGQSGDDAGTIHGPCAFSYTDNEVYFGACPNSSSITSGFNFKSIQIPQGAQIKYAYLAFTIDGDYTAPIGVQIYGDETGNSLNFNTGSPPASRPTPSALSPVAQWDISDTWSFTDPRERRVTPQLAPIIQNIVGREDWLPGNALSILVRNNGPTSAPSGFPWPVRRVFAWERAFDDATAAPAKLIVAYDSAAAPPALSQTFPSVAAQDGWILESTETSGVGGSINAGANTFTLGDNAADKQYRSILHFNTAALPPNAVITSATLRIKQQSITGTSPFTTHGNLVADIRNPYFGTGISLVAGDFQAAAGQSGVATFNPTPVSGWYTASLTSGLSHINLNGTTQFRLAFTLDDNDDLGVDTILFSSGNHGTAANRPQLVVEYYEDQGLAGTTP